MAIGATLVQSSLYDVPGGYRAVLFDRFSGVQPEVCSSLVLDGDSTSEMTDDRQREKEHIFWFLGFSERSCTMSGSSLE